MEPKTFRKHTYCCYDNKAENKEKEIPHTTDYLQIILSITQFGFLRNKLLDLTPYVHEMFNTV
jgi:hypothetical protein